MVNRRAPSGRLRTFAEIMECRSVDMCCVQESRFRVKSVRTIKGTYA